MGVKYTINQSAVHIGPDGTVAKVLANRLVGTRFGPLTPNSQSVFRVGVSLNIHSFIHSVLVPTQSGIFFKGPQRPLRSFSITYNRVNTNY